MTRLLVVVVLAGLAWPASASEPDLPLAPASAGVDPAMWPGSEAEVQLVWVDLARLPAFTFESTTRRVSRIVTPAGLDVAWQRQPAGTDWPVGGVNVVLLPSRRPGGPLGMTQVRCAGQASVWVYPAEVATAVGIPASHYGSWTLLEQQDMSNALAIVIVHELVHVFAGPNHGGSRLMAPSLRPRDLRDRLLALEAGTFRPPAELADHRPASLALPRPTP